MRVLLLLGLTGCASYNTMWNAEQRANDARRLEQQGQASEARAQWAQAASKAAKVRGEKALVLRVEALARAGACQDIDEPLAAARASAPSPDRGVRERLDLADAECALAIGDAQRAQAALGDPLESANADRRARAEYVAGRVAMLQQDYEAATAHFNRAREPDAAGRAFIAAQRALIARASERGDLTPIATELSRALRTTSGTDEAAHLIDLITAVQTVPPPTSPSLGARLHLAEVARDSLQAPRLAGRLLLEAVANDTASLFAPKALIAAMPLLPEQHDSIAALLDARYAASPYSRALHGEVSVAYTAAEDSLARELGMQGLIQRGGPAGPRPGGPSRMTGPRGPKLP